MGKRVIATDEQFGDYLTIDGGLTWSLDDLVIPGVDLELLERQRIELNGFLDDWSEILKSGDGVMTDRQLGALQGVLNMLDDWADSRERG